MLRWDGNRGGREDENNFKATIDDCDIMKMHYFPNNRQEIEGGNRWKEFRALIRSEVSISKLERPGGVSIQDFPIQLLQVLRMHPQNKGTK